MKFGTESITFREAKKAKDDIAIAVRNGDFVLDFEGVQRIDSTVLALSLHMLPGPEGGEDLFPHLLAQIPVDTLGGHVFHPQQAGDPVGGVFGVAEDDDPV